MGRHLIYNKKGVFVKNDASYQYGHVKYFDI
jgi:hypothetical protein